jgi:hypothetical protein
MTASALLTEDGRTLMVRVPLALRQRGGRKLVVAPEGAKWVSPRPRIDSTIIKAIARAFRWQKLLETGLHTTIAEVAAAEGINPTYVGRILRLTLLAPDIVETLLGGRQPSNLQLADLLNPFPAEWERQWAEIAKRGG